MFRKRNESLCDKDFLRLARKLFSTSEPTQNANNESIRDCLEIISCNDKHIYHFWTIKDTDRLSKLYTLKRRKNCIHLLNKRNLFCVICLYCETIDCNHRAKSICQNIHMKNAPSQFQPKTLDGSSISKW